MSGVPSGYTALDKITFGWQPEDLIVIAGHPSAGKTAFVLTMARNMAVDYKIPVGFFSFETAADRLVNRILLGETGLSYERFNGMKKMTREEWAFLHNAVCDICNAPLWFDDTPAIDTAAFQKAAIRMVDEHGIQVIIVDSMQMMYGPAAYKENREQEVTAVCRIIKETARKLHIPIIVTSQINRAMSARCGGNMRPQLSDLRESGAIEQIADIVMFIHRPEFVGCQETGGFPGETNLIIAKNRDGEVHNVTMRFLQSEVKFVDYNDRPYEGTDDISHNIAVSKIGSIFEDSDLEFNM